MTTTPRQVSLVLRDPCWSQVTVTECLGTEMYKVQLEDQFDEDMQTNFTVPVNIDTDNNPE